MNRHLIRTGFVAGAIAGLALGLLLWAAYLVNLLPYQIYLLTVGMILPPTLAFTIYGYLLGFLLYTILSGLFGILLASIVHHRLERSISWGIVLGIATLLLFEGFATAWFTPELPFWNLPQPALYFIITTRILYGAFLGYLYKQYLQLPTGYYR